MARLFGRACPVPIGTFVEPQFLSQARLQNTGPKRTRDAHFCKGMFACLFERNPGCPAGRAGL